MAEQTHSRFGKKVIWRAVSHVLHFAQAARTSRYVMHIHHVNYLVAVDADTGASGIGECAPLPGLSTDHPQRLRELIQNPGSWSTKDLHSLPALRFAVECALTDLAHGGSRVLYESDFTRGLKPLPINGLVWMGEKQKMLNEALVKAAEGYNCIKFKVGGIDFAEELDLLREFRAQFPHVQLRLDANGAFAPEEAIHKLEQLSIFHIHSIEQPVKPHHKEALIELAAISPIPIALDESLIGVEVNDGGEQLLDTLKPQYIVLKPTLLGGFEECSRWIELAAERHIGWWVTSALESNIGLNAIAQWTATLDPELHQGLGTGMLYTNNIKSPLGVQGGKLYYHPAMSWRTSTIQGLP